MTESLTLENKNKTTFRYIIEKMFCHHEPEIRLRVEVKDSKDNIVGINALLVCKHCGKTKNVRI